MSKWKRRQAAQKFKGKAARALKRLGAGLAALLLAASLLITVGEWRGWPTPTWKQLYARLGVGRTVRVPAEAEGAATRVHFLDVGQADAALLEQDGHFALLDAGRRETQDAVADYLRAAGVEELDYLILTHTHSDHLGGMRYILRHFPVKQVLLPDFDKAPLEYRATLDSFLAEAEAQGVPRHTMRQGETYLLGRGTLTVLLDGIESDNANNICPVMRFDAPHLRCLFTGDAEEPVEQVALAARAKLRADVFAAGHHGSSTSNGEAFLKKVRPDLVVVSCGDQNDYGHPHAAPLRTFKAVGAQVCRTDEMGNIVVYVDEDEIIQVAADRPAPGASSALRPAA